MTASEAPAPTFTQLTRPSELPLSMRRELAACWAAVVNAGGAVLPADCPLPPLTPTHTKAAVDRIAGELTPEHSRLLVATVDGVLTGWLLVRREAHPLEAHCGTVNHVQTHVRFRRSGVGTALMHRVRRIAREEMGLERLKLTVRSGLGLEDFYGKAGWTEVGRWPGALRLAPGDDRDEILMSLAL
ncbi:GCN5-related N-acetyltransferase [Streptomyces sp. SirexAA-E]|nr:MULTISPECIES: GNAT family N-acetyltransferase [unclassified Streptomyces]AEN08679.1 GCN5-related N-acetyltransferase [Streptomyces sp. SirexAA-E]